MRVEQTNNNIIDITFDPNEEGLCLLDFVLVEEEKEKFLAQVIELSGYKYDASLNIARVKIIYKINEKNEIIPYTGFTPTRACEISICNQKEIEDFINQGKETLELSINPKTMLPLKLNLDFFSNKPVILADRMDDFNLLSSNLSHILSDYKNVVIFDYTGSLDIEDSARLRAGVDFRLPLDYETINWVWKESMQDATIEVQAACDDIFNEVKSYLKTLRGKSIPYNLFLKTIIDAHKKNKNSALWYLKNKLVKYFDEQLFAQDIKDIELLSSTVKENKITIIDFSKVDTTWHKRFCEFILRSLQQDIYLFMRLNDLTSSVEIINKIYGKNKINVIPSVSYGYKKLPSISENFNNYIFLSTLSPIRNYGMVNPSILSLDANYALLFGENTKELIFKIQNTVSIDEEIKERKKVRKIQLENFQKIDEDFGGEFKGQEDVTPDIPNRIVVENTPFEEKEEEIKEEKPVENKLEEAKKDDFNMSEFQQEFNYDSAKEELFANPTDDFMFEDTEVDLTSFEPKSEDVEEEIEEQEEEIEEKLPELENEDALEESFQNLFEEKEEEPQEVEEAQEETEQNEFEYSELSDVELDFYEDTENLDELPYSEDNNFENDYEEQNAEEQSQEEPQEEVIEEEIIEETPVEEVPSIDEPQIIEEEIETAQAENIAQEEISNEPETIQDEENEELFDEQLSAFLDDTPDEPMGEPAYEVQEDVVEEQEENVVEHVETPVEAEQEEVIENKQEEPQESVEKEDPSFIEDIEIEDIELDDISFDDEDVEEEQKQEEVKEEEPKEDVAESVPSYDVIEQVEVEEEEKPQIAPENVYNVQVETEEVKEQPTVQAPVQEVQEEPKRTSGFREGEAVMHEKYGIGRVLEVIEYSNRTLLQLEFADIGKRLLDPEIANIKHLSDK